MKHISPKQIVTFLAAMWTLSFSITSAAQDSDSLTLLQEQDVRLAIIAERQLAANAALCDQQMPLTGMVLHSVDQYSADTATLMFENGPISVASIIPQSPAATAGLRVGDGVVAINGHPTEMLTADGEAPLRDAAFDLLARQPIDQPLTISVIRDGEPINAVLATRSGCRVLVEIITGSGLVGRSDGRVIQISYDLAKLIDDDGLAVIFAHELAHAALGHRTRLVAGGVRKGLLGEFGRNQQLNRQVEVEADRMSAHLLANAGYDANIAPHFWNSATGRGAGGGLLRSFIYPSPTSRADLIAQEIALYLPLMRGPSWPGHLLALRNAEF